MRKIFIILLITSALFSCSESVKTNTDKISIEETSVKNENLNPEDVVKTFIEDLGAGNFKNAFKKSKVKDWGDFDKFSSDKSFGGIVATKINKIESKPDENGKAVVYTEAHYSDKENGDNTFKQNFYLQQFGGQWKIVKMKLKETIKKIRFEKYEFEKTSPPNNSGHNYSVSMSIELPLNDKKLLKTIIKSIDGNSPANTAQEYFEKTYQSYEEMPEETHIGWDYGERGYVVYKNNKILCYGVTGGGYLGGAHGFGFSKYSTYNLKNYKIIKLNMIFNGKNYLALQEKIYAKIKSSRKLKDKEMQDTYELPILPTENFYINNKGIGFDYNSYAISSYVNGSDDVFFTFNELSEMIKADFKINFLN